MTLSLLAFLATAQAGTTIVVSDLHLGLGKTDGGEWHAFEDFRWPERFDAFLDDYAAAQPAPVRLVVAGDLLELWQTRDPTDCQVDGLPLLGCTKAEIDARLDPILESHARTLADLDDWLGADATRRLYIVPGNHDAGLLFPDVGKRLMNHFSAHSDQAVLVTKGEWFSDDGRVYVAHGHQAGENSNSYPDWPEIRHPDEPQRMYRPAGEKLVHDWYDTIEVKSAVFDNLESYPLMAKVGAAGMGVISAPLSLKTLTKAIIIDANVKQIGSFLDSPSSKQPWDLRAIREQGGAFLVDSVSDRPDDAAVKQALRDAAHDGSLTLDDWSDEELIALCEMRRTLLRDEAPPPGIKLCPTTEDGSLGDIRAMIVGPADYEPWLNERRKAEAGFKDVEVVVFGHTHAARKTFLLDVADDGPPVRYVNSGAWQPIATSAFIWANCGTKAWGACYKWAYSEMTLDDLPACYSFIQIADGRRPGTYFWSAPKGSKKFSRTTDCPGDLRFAK